MFADFFQTTYSTSSPHAGHSYPYMLNSINCMNSPAITESSLLCELKLNKPVLTPFVLKYCAVSLCRPLHKLFTLSIDSSSFPNLWKDSYIPLHKKDIKCDVLNYRGIAKLSAIPQLLEKIITSHLQHLCGSIISLTQHELMRCRSTTNNLLEFTSIVIKGFKKNIQTDVIKGER